MVMPRSRYEVTIGNAVLLMLNCSTVQSLPMHKTPHLLTEIDNIPHARVPQLDRYTALDSPSCFEQFENWMDHNYRATKLNNNSTVSTTDSSCI